MGRATRPGLGDALPTGAVRGVAAEDARPRRGGRMAADSVAPSRSAARRSRGLAAAARIRLPQGEQAKIYIFTGGIVEGEP